MSRDWAPLSDADPTPGDPDRLVEVARQLECVADGMEDTAATVSELTVGNVWAGLAAQRFEAARQQVPESLRALALRCSAAALALRRHAASLQDAQDLARAALALARSASADEQIALNVLRRSQDWRAERPDEPWPGADGAQLLAAAREDLRQALKMLEDAEDRHAATCQATTVALDGATADVLEDPWFLAQAAPVAEWVLGAPISATFVRAADRLRLNTREAWRAEAYRRAGIDPDQWDPRRGIADLDVVAQQAWELYAQLYRADPDRFLWAGMAKAASASIYAGLQDVHVVRLALDRGEDLTEKLDSAVPGLVGEMLNTLGESTEAGAAVLAAAETTLLSMQRQIFDDLAWQHLAFEAGGTAALEATAVVPDHMLAAWRDIESGDQRAIAAANKALLHHEQLTVIGDDYDRFRESSVLADAFTFVLSVTAESPIPGGRPFRDVVRRESGPLSLPVENVTIFEHRWEWIEEDLYPAWLGLIRAGQASGLVATPVDELARQRRLIPDSLLPYRPGVKEARRGAPAADDARPAAARPAAARSARPRRAMAVR